MQLELAADVIGTVIEATTALPLADGTFVLARPETPELVQLPCEATLA